MRPGQTKVLLFVVLIGAFANNDVVRDEFLTRVLPTAVTLSLLARVPIESARVIARRKIKSLLPAKDSRSAAGSLGTAFGKTIDDALNKRTICRSVVGRCCLKPVCRIAFRQCEYVAIEIVGARVLSVVQADETKQLILDSGNPDVNPN